MRRKLGLRREQRVTVKIHSVIQRAHDRRLDPTRPKAGRFNRRIGGHCIHFSLDQSVQIPAVRNKLHAFRINPFLQ